jgi:hypothetical protein
MPEIIVGCALSDVNHADLPGGLRVPERLADYAERFRARVGSPAVSFQLQPEDSWTLPAVFPDQFVPRKMNRWWRAVQTQPRLLSILTGPPARIGVHQPIQKRDVLSSNYFSKYEAIEETKQAMDFAQYVGAEYFVFHLAQVDKWNWERRDQMAKAIKLFDVFATYYTAQGMSFVPLIETLEYPKFPATGSEAFTLLLQCRKALPDTQIAFDITHLWSSRQRMVECGAWPDARVSFESSLDYALGTLAKDTYLYQLGGAWESETHAVPGLHPQQDPFRYPLKLRESHGVYSESGEMDLNRVLEMVTNSSVRSGRNLHLVLQIFDRDIDQVLEATRLIRNDLLQRMNQPVPQTVTARPRRGLAAAATKLVHRTGRKNGKGAAKKGTRSKKR